VPEVRGRLLAVVVGSGGRTSLAIRVAAAQARAGLVETITRGWSTASRMPPFEADEGTRTLDLLHGKRSRRSVFMPGIAVFADVPAETRPAFMALPYPSIPCVSAAIWALAAETERQRRICAMPTPGNRSVLSGLALIRPSHDNRSRAARARSQHQWTNTTSTRRTFEPRWPRRPPRPADRARRTMRPTRPGGQSQHTSKPSRDPQPRRNPRVAIAPRDKEVLRVLRRRIPVSRPRRGLSCVRGIRRAL
jgi:hypothetical protein